MPQFDAYSFSSQIFYLLIGLTFYYFFTSYFYVVELSSVLKFRKSLMSSALSESNPAQNLFGFYFPKLFNLDSRELGYDSSKINPLSLNTFFGRLEYVDRKLDSIQRYAQ